MALTSIIIPACHEIFLQKTIDSILETATGEIEVIVYLDGYWPNPPINDDPRVVLLHDPTRRGMRCAINSAASIAKGKYLCKFDGHCLMAKGFNEVLSSECDKDWIVVPRRHSLDAEKWAIEENGKVRDAHYLSYPTAFGPDTYLGFGMHVKDWPERGKERKDALLDDDMISQGSCWLMHKEYFDKLGGLHEEGFGTFIQESQDIMLRAWLTGGRVLCNKKTWYAHLWKGRKWGRMYELSRVESKIGEIFSADYWYNNKCEDRIHDLEWLIDKFWPVPTWPENWKELKIDFPEPPKIQVTVPEIIKENVMVLPEHKKTRDETVAYVLNKFNIKEIPRLPIEIDYNRSQWGILFSELGYKIGAEIGVYAGDNSVQLCAGNPGVKHYAIDSWLIYPGLANYKIQKYLSRAEQMAREALAPYNCEIIKKTSMEAVKDFADNSLDYVYVDGNHNFISVCNDVIEWEKKVRPGGIVAGHDFDLHKFSTQCHVKQFVTAYTAATGIYPWFITSKACRTIEERFKDIPTSDGNYMTSFFWVKA